MDARREGPAGKDRMEWPTIAPLVGVMVGGVGAVLLLLGMFGTVFIAAGALVIAMLLAPLGLGAAALADRARKAAVHAPALAAQAAPMATAAPPSPIESPEPRPEDMAGYESMEAPAAAAGVQGAVSVMAGNGAALERAEPPVLAAPPMSLAYPKNAVVAIVDDHADAEDALRALRGAGLTAEDVLPAGPQGPARGERAAGRRSSLLRKAATWLVAEEDRMLQAYDEEIRVGRHIIAVHAVKRQDVQRAASVLATHRAHTIRQFGRWLITDLVPAGGHAMERSPRQPLAAPQEFETVAAHELRATDIFRELSAQQLAEIAAIGRHVRVPMGTCLARQGETGARVYVILEGQVELTTGSPQGEITVRVAGPGESLPLAALLGERTLISTATAMSDIRAMEFSHDAFGDLCRRHPDIGMMVYQAVADILGGRYRKTLTRLVGTFERALRQADAFANV